MFWQRKMTGQYDKINMIENGLFLCGEQKWPGEPKASRHVGPI